MNNLGKTLSMIAAVGLMLSAALPVATITSIFGSQSLYGFQGDGLISGAIGLIVLLISLNRKATQQKPFFVVGAILSGLALIILVPKIGAFSNIIAETGTGVSGSIGLGLPLGILAAILGIIGGLYKGQAETDKVPAKSARASKKPGQEKVNPWPLVGLVIFLVLLPVLCRMFGVF